MEEQASDFDVDAEIVTIMDLYLAAELTPFFATLPSLTGTAKAVLSDMTLALGRCDHN
jgi:hypothetical protein